MGSVRRRMKRHVKRVCRNLIDIETMYGRIPVGLSMMLSRKEVPSAMPPGCSYC